MTGPTAPLPPDLPPPGVPGSAEPHGHVPPHLRRSLRRGDITLDDVARVLAIQAAAPEWPPPIEPTGAHLARTSRDRTGADKRDGAAPPPGAADGGASVP